MAVTINADDGVISGSAGLKSTPDGSGILALQTNGTTAITINASQNTSVSGNLSLSSGYGLSIARTAVTSPASTDGNVYSGTYTPSQVTTGTNVDAVTFTACQYMRVGSVVTVSGLIGIDATTANTDTIVYVSLPITSNIGASGNLGGAGESLASPYAGISVAITGNVANDCAEFRLRPTATTNINHSFSFTYQII